MDLRTTYGSTKLEPFYAGSGAIASVSEDGRLLATSVVDKINIVSLENPRQVLHSVESDDEQDITALHLTPDGSFLCFVSQAQLLRVYSLSQKRVIRSMKVSSPVYVMDCDQTSTLLAIGGTDGSVSVIDIENGFVTHSLKGHGATISSVKFYGELNSETWKLASGDTNGMIKIWDLVKRSCQHTLQEHTSAVRGLDFRATDEENGSIQLLSGGRDNIINLYEFSSKKKHKLLKTIPIAEQVESCGFTQDPEVVYSAGGSAIYQLVSLSTGKVLKKTTKPIEELFIIGTLCILSGTKQYLVLSDQTLFLIDVEAALESDSEVIDVESKIAGNHGTIADIRFVGPKLDKLALATNSPTLRIIPTPTSAEQGSENEENKESFPIEVDMYEGHTDLLNSLDATSDGLWVATASKDHTVILWRYYTNQEKFFPYAKFVGHVGSVNAVGLPNVMPRSWPEFIITASNDLTVKKWKVPKVTSEEPSDVILVKTSEYTRRAHEKDINAISISPNDSIFATASYDKTCKIWNLDDGEFQATLANHKRGLWDVSFCQYDKLLATCSGDKTIKIWSLETYAVVKTLEGHTNAVQRCSFINKNKQLISTGADGLVIVWDLSTGESVKTLDAHNNRIWALAVMNDGESFVTADADGFFEFWKDNSEEEHERNLEEEKLKIEQEQSLQNYLAEGDWTNAFLLAMTLDHPMRLYNVLRQSVDNSNSDPKIVFNKEIDDAVSTLNNDQILLLVKRCRDWNTNARTHTIAQKVVRCILLRQKIEELSEIPGLVRIIESIISYAQRHYSRMDNLVQESYILDYALVQMDRLL
ncbi:unnamed protein product [Kluyveromyces dobzhanskii CBS 2104]|uniref:WGS project CCBQ000000000 data, contig 00010 n=1 Tax=Kluyveromyces dobzhanskii CBS 2104 TaxID=1427455 RepID=A0A0A8LAQ9_9SACH|nr:unnamed protein product [Kluyveromyces dobzhanskii CBS 2104]